MKMRMNWILSQVPKFLQFASCARRRVKAIALVVRIDGMGAGGTHSG